MDAMGFSLSIVTLLALSLVIGLLVDDAIVEVENIERHIGMGKPPTGQQLMPPLKLDLPLLQQPLR